MNENEISYKIRGAIFNAYNNLGPGLLESVYEEVLFYELYQLKLNVKRQITIPIVYNNIKLEAGFRADLIVEDKVIIEINSVESINEVHHKQLLTYLRLTNLKLGILVNFNTDKIDKSIFRKINGEI